MNASLINKLPFCVLQNLFVSYIKELQFEHAWELLGLVPSLATTKFKPAHPYKNLEELLHSTIENPKFNAEDISFIRLFLLPFSDRDDETQLSSRYIKLIAMMAWLHQNGKRSSTLEQILDRPNISGNQTKTPLRIKLCSLYSFFSSRGGGLLMRNSQAFFKSNESAL